MSAMVDFVAAFGARYDNDPRIFMVHVGLYGMWGEWHIFPFETNYSHLQMTDLNKGLIANQFLNSFPKTKLLARYPASMPSPEKFGYSDGLFFEHSIGSPPWYFDNILQASDVGHAWMNHPIGGEVSPVLQDTLFHEWPNLTGNAIVFPDENNATFAIQDMTESITVTHSTWLFANYLFIDESYSKITQAEINNAIRIQKSLGYTFFLDKYKLTATNGIPTLEAGIINKGIAPMYANWDVEFAVINGNGTIESLNTQKWDLDEILPSNQSTIKTSTSATSLVDGTYTVIMRIINPLSAYTEDAPPVRFANETQDLHEKGWLTLGEMSLLNGSINNVSDAITTGPYGGTNRLIPGKIEGESYNVGGNGLGYTDDNFRTGHELDYRPYDKVDIERKKMASNGFVVAHSNVGELLNYTVDVAETGNYDIILKYYCATNPGELRVNLDNDELATITGMQTQINCNVSSTITVKNVFIEAGINKHLSFEYVNGAGFDIDFVEFVPGALIVDGTYTIKSKSNAFMRPSNSGGTLVSESNQMGDSTKWVFTHLGDNVYTIASAQFPGERLAAQSAGCLEGTLLEVTTQVGAANNLEWKAKKEGNYLIFEAMHCTGKAIDIWAGNPSTVHIWFTNETNDNQLFELIPDANNVNTVLNMQENLLEKTDITVYPNPVSSTLNVRISKTNNSPSEIKIFNLQGVLLYAETTTNQITSIDAAALQAKGMIIVQITNQEQTSSFKVIKL